MATPFVSIVIPTHARPQFLVRAVESCVQGVEPGPVEVIVVANGGESPADAVAQHPAVRVIKLAVANGNAARNAGLAAANGRFVRFLDDDDYLLPAGASVQHRIAGEANADVCTGATRLVDAAGNEFRVITPHHATGDFVAAMLSPGSATQTTANLFRTEFLKDLWWDPARPHLQDFEWMHTVMRRCEANWVAIDQPVGVWQHHAQARVSTGALKQFPDMALREMTAITSKTIAALEGQGRLTDSRKRVAAQALWHYAHLGFPMSPRYWAGVAKAAMRLDPRSRPEPDFYHRAPWRHVHPLLLEWLLAPKRKLNLHLREG